MSDETGFDPRRLPDPEVQDPDVSRDVELGTAARADFTAPDTTPVADADVPTLLEMLESSAAPTRRRAILALAERRPGAEVHEELLGCLREDPDPEVRQFAVEALAKAGADPETIHEGLDDEDPWVRAETVVSLKKVAPETAVDAFERMGSDPNPAVRRNALISLHHVQGADCVEALRDGLDDESERVREWAVRLLASVDAPGVESTLADHLESESSDIVRGAAGRALGGDVDVDISGGTATRQAGDHVLNRPPGR